MKDDLLYLSHIKQAMDRIISYTNKDRETFIKSTMMQDAVIRNFEVMGEATKRLSSQFREAHSQVPWSLMARTRDRIIHDYAGVRLDILWATIENDLIPLQK